MNFKIFKIIFLSWKKYLLFVFISTFLSLFSYILGNNIVLWVQDYLLSQIRPILSWDLVISWNQDLKDENYLEKYKNNFEIAKTITTNTTLFDKDKKSSLVELVYVTPNYPFYNSFTFDTLNESWSLIVDKKIYDRFWKDVEIFWVKYNVKWTITSTLLWDFSIYWNSLRIYIPIENFDNNKLNISNSRLSYKFHFKFLWDYDETLFEKIKNDENFKSYRIRTIEDRDENIWNITDRFYLFINFFNLVVFVLTFFIIILSLETFFKKIKTTIWLLNIFWMKKVKIFFYSFFVLMIIFLFSFLVSYLLNFIFINILNNYYNFFKVYDIALLKWLLVTFVLLFVWVFSPFYKIFKAKIKDLLDDNSNFSNFNIFDYIIYLFLIFSWFSIISYISSLPLNDSIFYSWAFVLLITLFYIFVVVILKVLFLWFNFFNFFRKNFYSYDAIRSTIKPWNVSFLVVFSSLISFVSIFIFFVFSWSFLSYLWTITQNSNDTYILNVQQKDLETINKYFSEDEIFEIVTLRIREINWVALKDYLWVEETPRKFSREFFSTTKYLDNRIVLWNNLTSSWVSVDEEFAKELWLKIWDEIKFSSAWLEKKLIVQNFREALRDWTNPFFYFQLYKGDFENFPKNYIISYSSAKKPENIEYTLWKEIWDYISFISTKEIIEIILDVSFKVLFVVYTCLLYVFVFSFLSFVVSISFLKSFKIFKLKILNILWWNKNKLINWLSLEYIYLVFIWLLISIWFWSVAIYFIFYFVKILKINYLYYSYWILILLFLLFLTCLYLFFSNNKRLFKDI